MNTVGGIVYTFVALNTSIAVTLPDGLTPVTVNEPDETTNIDFNLLTGIGDKDETNIPQQFALMQNFPNPFNPTTVISSQLPVVSQVELSIYNLLGQKITTLVSEKQPVGTYKLEWDAGGLASGLYFYRLKTDEGFIQTKKLILLK